MRARCKENTREFSRLNDVYTTNRVNRASNALERNQSVTSEPKRKKKRDTFHYFRTKIEGKKNWRETVKPLTLGIETGCRREERKEVCETGSGRKLEGRGLWSGLVWSGLVWSGLVWYASSLSSSLSLLLLDVSSFKRSLIKVQLQVKLKHDDNVAGSPPLPRPGKGSFSESGEEAGWNLSGRKQPSKLLLGDE